MMFGFVGFRRHEDDGSLHSQGAIAMIARTWKGETPESKADQYFAFLKETGIKDYQETKLITLGYDRL